MRLPNFLMPDKFTVRPRVGHGGKGWVWGPEYSQRGQIEFREQNLHNAQGEELVSTVTAICPADCPIKAMDHAFYDGRTLEAIDVQTVRVFGLVHHVEVLFREVGEL